jgi:hypothetical protein
VNGSGRAPPQRPEQYPAAFRPGLSDQSQAGFRGGYGLYYTNFQSNGMMQTLGFSSTTTLVNSLDGGQTSIPNLLNNPFPTGSRSLSDLLSAP